MKCKPAFLYIFKLKNLFFKVFLLQTNKGSLLTNEVLNKKNVKILKFIFVFIDFDYKIKMF